MRSLVLPRTLAGVFSILAFCLCSSPYAWADNAKDIEAIKSKAKDLIALISANPTIWGDLSSATEIASLRTQINNIQRTKDVPFIKERANELTAWLESGYYVLDSGGAKAELKNLRNKISAKLRAAHPIDEAVEMSSDLREHLGSVPPILQEVRTALFARPAATTPSFIERVEEVEAIHPHQAAKRRSASLTLLLKEPAYRELISTVLPDLKTLNTTLDEWTSTVTRRVYVVAATYGDTRKLNSAAAKRRRCDATAAVRADCSREADCPKKLTFENACGFDPVPFADPRIKGLMVRYVCVSNRDAEWASLLKDPTLAKRKYKENYALLHTSAEKIVCNPPLVK